MFRAEGDRPAIGSGGGERGRRGRVGGGLVADGPAVADGGRVVDDGVVLPTPRTVIGPAVLPEDDFAGKVVLAGLPPGGRRSAYRVTFRDLATPQERGVFPAAGSFLDAGAR